MIELLLHLTLSLEQFVHLIIRNLFAELCVDLVELFQQTDSLLYGFLNNFAYCSPVINQRFLFEKANRKPRRDHRLPQMILIHACEYAQQRRLPRSIETNNANLRAIEIRKINVSQDRLLVIELT